MYKKKQVVQFSLGFFAATVVILATCYLLHTTVFAQSIGTRNLTVVPPTVTVNVDPGGKSEGVIKVINDGSDPLSFYVDTQDFIVTDTTGIPSILPPNTFSPKYSASAWVGVAPSQFTLPPHQKAELNYYIQVPLNARPGGHYTAVIFKPQTDLTQNQTGATVQTQIGTLFSVHVNGKINESAQVTKFSAPGFSEYGPIMLDTQIKNLGDSDITPKGSIALYDTFGHKVATALLDEHRIFPEAGRDFTNTFGFHFMMGRYTAVLLASYGANNNLPLSAEITFVIFPWKIAVVVVLLIIAAILGYFVWKRRKNTPPTTQNNTNENTENTQTIDAPTQTTSI